MLDSHRGDAPSADHDEDRTVRLAVVLAVMSAIVAFLVASCERVC
jgi:hypothetical protein